MPVDSVDRLTELLQKFPAHRGIQEKASLALSRVAFSGETRIRLLKVFNMKKLAKAIVRSDLRLKSHLMFRDSMDWRNLSSLLELQGAQLWAAQSSARIKRQGSKGSRDDEGEHHIMSAPPGGDEQLHEIAAEVAESARACSCYSS